MKTCKVLAALATLLAPAAAGADVDDELHRYGMNVSAGGGLVMFVHGTGGLDLGEVDGPGGGWEARVAFGTRTPLAIEAAYVGSFQGLPLGPNLLGNGVEANLRLNMLLGAVRPYVLAGVGWTRYSLVTPRPDMSLVGDGDDTAAFPMGAGVGVHVGRFAIDLRAVYRKTASVDRFGSMDSLSATLRAGFEY